MAALGVASYGCSETTEPSRRRPFRRAGSHRAPRRHGEFDLCGRGGQRRRPLCACTCGDLIVTGSLSVNPPRDMRGPAMPPGAPPPSFVPPSARTEREHLGVHARQGLVGGGARGRRAAGGRRHDLGNVRSGGGLDLDEGAFVVAGDAFVNGNVDGPFAIQGSIHLPRRRRSRRRQGRRREHEPVSVSPPCGSANGPPSTSAPQSRAAARRQREPRLRRHATGEREQHRDHRLALWRVLPDGDTHRPGAALSFASMDTSALRRGDVRLGNNLHVTLDPGPTSTWRSRSVLHDGARVRLPASPL